MPELPPLPEEVRVAGPKVALGWLLENGLTLEDLSQEIGERIKAAAAVHQGLDEAGQDKLRTLFESPNAGYQGYALKLLCYANIDLDNLPEGSAPLWESPEAAWAELLANLTPAHLEVIQRDYKEPAIVIEPIRAHAGVYVKDASVKDYDRRVVGDTPFAVSNWSAAYLDQADTDNNAGSINVDRIVGWKIGIADKVQVTKVLATDGDVTKKPLQDRARDFHDEGGYGAKGFSSTMDHPGLYGLIMNGSRQGDLPRPIDDIGASDGVWTMGTTLYGPAAKVYDPSMDDYSRVAGGDWNRYGGYAHLDEYHADAPNSDARVRLAVMFKKA